MSELSFSIPQLQDQIRIRALKLTPEQTRILSLLLKREITTLEILYESYSHRFDAPLFLPNLVRVHIYNLRRKLTPLGVKIKKVWGIGYSISADDKKRIHEILEAANAS